jgi:RND family efflux transporter MFP subunit
MKAHKTGKAGRRVVMMILLIALCASGAYLFFIGRSEKTGAEARQEEHPQGTPTAYVRIEVAADDKTARDSTVQNMSIEAVDRVRLIPRVTGRLEKLHVKTGDRVKRGQLIATLEHQQQDALIGSTEAQVASARADAERARAEMSNAKTNLDRYDRLLKEGFSTRQQYDSMSTAYASARAGHNAAVAKERQAAAELERVRSTRQDYIMYSPLDGSVLSDYSLTPGEMISPSSPIVDIADLRRLKASLRIPEIKIFAVKPGMDVLLRFDALPGEEFHGKVTRVDPYVDPSTRTSAVEIELDNESTGNRLRPGMFGQASLVEREFSNAVLMPASAVQTGDDGPFVFVESDGIARMRPVKTGIRQGDHLHITEGVASGDRVIVFGGANLSDGDKVAIQ